MNKRLLEILKRQEEIRAALAGNQEGLDLDALEAEARALAEEKAEIEQRERIAQSINNGTAGVNGVEAREVKQPNHSIPNEMEIYETEEYRNAFMGYVMRGAAMPVEFRANANTKQDDVGAIIPTTTLNKILEKLTSYGRIIPLVNQTNYKTGLAIPIANIKPTATWTDEGKTSDNQKETLGASITFNAFKLRCAVSVSLEVEVKAWSAFENMLVKHLAEAMAVALEEAIINGDGNKKPTGLLKDAAAGVKVTGDKATYQLLTDAEGELDEAYEEGPKWYMTKKTFMKFMGMVDENGQPIARTNYGVDGKQERTLLGRSVVVIPYLKTLGSTNIADGDVFAFLFDFKNYTVNTAYNIGVKIYEDNETDDIVRKSIMLVDGKPTDTNGLVKLAYKAAAK